MQTFQEMIDKLYSEELSEAQRLYEDEELYSRFTAYMDKKYGAFLARLSARPDKLATFLEEWYSTELRFWGDMSAEQKYARFTPDESFRRLEELSRSTFAMAMSKYDGKPLSTEELEGCSQRVEEIKALMDSIFPANRREAEKLLSEAVVETDYLCNDAEIYSLRMAAQMRYR